MTLRSLHPLILAALIPLALGMAILLGLFVPTFVWVSPPPSDLGVDASTIKMSARTTLRSNQYDLISKKPLFNDDRQPDPPPPPPPPPKLPPLPSADNYRLVGLVLSPDVHIALVRRQKDGSVARLKPGDPLDGWTVQVIDPTGVQLSGQNTSMELKVGRAASNARGVEGTARTIAPASPLQHASAASTAAITH
jgi:hypothetical protein